MMTMKQDEKEFIATRFDDLKEHLNDKIGTLAENHKEDIKNIKTDQESLRKLVFKNTKFRWSIIGGSGAVTVIGGIIFTIQRFIGG